MSSEIDRGSFVEIRLAELAENLGVNIRSAQSWQSKEGWSIAREEGRFVYYTVPQEFIDKKRKELEDRRKDPRTIAEPSNEDQTTFDPDLLELIVNPYKEANADLRKQVELLTILLEKERQDKDILNRTIESQNTQIVKYRDERRANDRSMKPWWKIW